MQKRIVVLGGVGFIGSHLCLRLLNDGHEVFCVDIRDTADSPLLRDMPPHPEFRYVRHNIVNAFGIRCDEIYNLAAPSRVRYNKALPVESLKVSILGSINALDTARSEHASSTHPPETSTARDTATPRSRRRTVVRHTAPSPKANGPERPCTAPTSMNSGSTHASRASSTPTAAAPT